MKTPLSLALLSLVPVALLALLIPQLLPKLITAAILGEIGFLVPISKRLVELKNERGHPVPFRERHPLLLSLAGCLCYAAIGLGSLSELDGRLVALIGAASFAVSKLWLGNGPLWPYRRPGIPQ
jgi:hypothetical protein